MAQKKYALLLNCTNISASESLDALLRHRIGTCKVKLLAKVSRGRTYPKPPGTTTRIKADECKRRAWKQLHMGLLVLIADADKERSRLCCTPHDMNGLFHLLMYDQTELETWENHNSPPVTDPWALQIFLMELNSYQIYIVQDLYFPGIGNTVSDLDLLSIGSVHRLSVYLR